jgi:hypothetical protein
MKRVACHWVIIAVILSLAPQVAGAQERVPRAMVNGVLLDAQIHNVSGSLLLPMRAVFEALGAKVRWFPAARQITAARGNVTVQLWIDRRVAIVNDREVTLAVPPTLIDGSTYVPLRFPAEAFGGKVEWWAPQRLAVVTIDPLVEVAAPPADDPPPPAEPAMLTGVLIARDGDNLVLREQQAGELRTVTVPADAAITRNKEAAALADLLPGDLLEVTRDAAGEISGVDAAYLLVSGKAAGFAEGKLLLQDGSLFQLNPHARVLDAQGSVVPLGDLSHGLEVTLRLTPGTIMIWGITVPPPTPAPDPVQIAGVPGDLPPVREIDDPVAERAAVVEVAVIKPDEPDPMPEREPEIFAVLHDADRPLRRGDTLAIRVVATPGADRVIAGVGNAITGIELSEREPGRYEGEVTIGSDIRLNNAPVFAALRHGEVIREAESVERVTVDTLPPQYSLQIPEAAETYRRDYALGASFGDDETGIDAVRLLLNGRDVTSLAVISDRDIRYHALDLPIGVSTFRLELFDRAGNMTSREWQVVVREKPPLVLSVSHDARGLLKRGDALTIRVIGTPGAIEARARIGDALTNIRLLEREPGRYYQRVTINEKVYATDVYVYALLHQNGLDSEEVRSELRVTLDGEPPECLTISPQRGAVVYTPNPVIEATYRDRGTDIVPGRVRLRVNGRDVTAQAIVSNHKIRYAAQGFPLGTVTVELTLEDRAGNVTRVDWTFSLQLPPAILEVSHDAAKPLNPGEALKITARLSVKPAKLEWLLGDRVIGEAPAGAGAGIYTFLYTIKPADAAGKHKIGLRCTTEDGKTETTYAGALLTIAALKAKDLAISAPGDKAKSPNPLTVAGVAAPNARVRVTVTGSSILPILRKETQVAQVTVNTDGDGLWTTQPIALPADKAIKQFTVTAELLDENGNVVKKATIRLTR